MTAALRWRVYAGLDPGAETGLVAIALPMASARIIDARLVGYAHVSAGTIREEAHERAGARALLFHRIREQLRAWRAEVIVMEEPWDALPQWKTRTGGENKKGGASTGTIFGMGAHFGLGLAAASDLGWETQIFTYPVTSAREKVKQTKRGERVKPERIGWMQRRMSTPPPHERVALEMALQLRTLKERPANGVLPTAAELAREEKDDVYMALGVLCFHLDRERGLV